MQESENKGSVRTGFRCAKGCRAASPCLKLHVQCAPTEAGFAKCARERSPRASLFRFPSRSKISDVCVLLARHVEELLHAGVLNYLPVTRFPRCRMRSRSAGHFLFSCFLLLSVYWTSIMFARSNKVNRGLPMFSLVIKCISLRFSMLLAAPLQCCSSQGARLHKCITLLCVKTAEAWLAKTDFVGFMWSTELSHQLSYIDISSITCKRR